MKKLTLLFLGTIVSSVSLLAQDGETGVGKQAEDFIKRWGYDKDYSRFTIETNVSYDHGLCYYDPCDYYDEEAGSGYDYLTTLRYDPATGLNYELYGMYHINRFIGVGLGLKYFYGMSTEQTRTGGGEGSTYDETVKWRASMFSVIPTVQISPGWNQFNPFIDIGAIIGVMPRINEKETNTSYYGTSSTVIASTGNYHGGIPVGFDIKAGVDYKVSKLLDIYAALDFQGMNYTPSKFSLKTYEVNGVDQFSSLTTKQKETVYVKNYDRSETIPNDSPNKALKETYPFTSLGIDIGVKFNLGARQPF
jgi:hypothetical protein